MKKQVLFLTVTFIFGCLLMLSCDKEQFVDVETDSIQTQEQTVLGEELADVETDEADLEASDSSELLEEESEKVLYRNSFETAEELASVFTYRFNGGNYERVASTDSYNYALSKDNAPRSGGEQSLMAYGAACSVSHFFVSIEPFETDQNVLVKFWAQDQKADEKFGFVRINIVDDGAFYDSAANYDADIKLEIDDTVWKPYQSQEILHVPAGKFLQLDVVTYGGTGSGSKIYLDLLEVISAE